ncbi:hypothetical protein HYH03_014758 [Edaphochlamys debaryana]|uniref:Ankyrin repeat domain-containing protein n=1 Tax=Edaphochlamys debaryana TaxID=47281 RepID=A0A835XM36_9CHLO|nr:hypothetical protein HYH03_014758 [Edaphochlamys debaryana]|eukprot:KAG2486588.1 hypothetical protein HYH03_014758 [Edaphochlamys debaryana]
MVQAVVRDQPTLLAGLLAMGGDPDAPLFAAGGSLFEAALMENRPQCARVLLRFGHSPARCEEASARALLAASKSGNVQCLELVVGEAGVDARQHGYFALAKATAEGRTEVVEALLRAGAAWCGGDPFKRVALLLAAAESECEAVAAEVVRLGGSGALPQGPQGWQCLQRAARAGKAGLELLLRQAMGGATEAAPAEAS